MESYPLPTATVYLALFTGLTNPSEIRSRLVAASTLPDDEHGKAERDKLDFAFVEASMISSRLHILTAIQQALISQSSPSGMKTKTIHSEILWQLEPGSNISDSLKHFGLSPSTSSLLLIHIAPLSSMEDRTRPAAKAREEAVFERMINVVGDEEGGKSGVTLVGLEVLGKLDVKDGKKGTDWKSLRKIYKLNQDPVLKDVDPSGGRELELIDQLCISTVALKTVAA